MILNKIFQRVIGTKRFDEFLLYLNKDSKTINIFLKDSTTIFFVALIAITLCYVFGVISLAIFLILFLISLPIILSVKYIFVLFMEEQKQKKIESQLQDVLLQASLFPKGTEITKIIDYISKQKYQYISLEFKIALKQIKKGHSVKTSLLEICNRNKSKLLERVINLLIIGYKSGKDMHFVFNKISQYILRIHELERERYSSLSIQKYTLLLASAVLVPLILGWIQNIISGFDFSSFQTIGVITPDIKLAIYAKYATWIYLAELSIISSVFIALIDGNKRKFILYLLIILPLAYLIFFLV